MKPRSEEHKQRLSESLKKFYSTQKGDELRGKQSKFSRRAIHTPFGVFDSGKNAASHIGISSSTVSDLVQSDSFPEWYYFRKGTELPVSKQPKVEEKKVEIIERKLQPR
jgi:hypothetical protein